jgi:hypothetical protein
MERHDATTGRGPKTLGSHQEANFSVFRRYGDGGPPGQSEKCETIHSLTPNNPVSGRLRKLLEKAQYFAAVAPRQPQWQKRAIISLAMVRRMQTQPGGNIERPTPARM